MNLTLFLVDNNALIALKRKRVRTAFFADHCRVTSDVLHEAAEHRERRVLAGNVEPVTPAVLEHIRDLMAGVEVGDISLVDLYGNKGAADPGLVATVLAAMAAQDGYLFPDIWVIVTADNAVLELADRYQIPTMTPADLAALIDASTTTAASQSE
jgi:hypothetical protein